MLLFISSSIIIILSSYFLASIFSLKKNLDDFILVCFLFAIGQIIFIETLLGFLGRLYLGNIILFESMIFLISYSAFRKNNPQIIEKENFSFIYNSKILIFAISVFLAFFLPKLWKTFINPPLGADALSNHLTFPVTWLKNGNLNNPMLIFGTGISQGVSQASTNSVSYYPFNAELIFLWFIFPLRNALLANVAQAPFYFMGILAIYSILRKFYISKEISLFIGLLWVIIPNCLKHITQGAYNDIICAAMFFIVINNLLLLKSNFNKKNALLFGISVGIFLGIKSINIFWMLSLAPLFVYLLISRARHLKLTGIFNILILALIAIFIFGSYSYIRNFVLTGNIFYPVRLAIFGKTIMPGYVDKAKYINLSYPFKDFSLRNLFFGEGLGLQLFAFILPATFLPLFLSLFRFHKRKVRLDEVFIYLIPFLMFLLYSFYIRSYWTRYLYSYLGVGFVCSAIFLNKFRWGKRYVNIAGALCIFTTIPELAKNIQIFISLAASILLFFIIWRGRNCKFLVKIHHRRLFRISLHIFLIILLFLGLTLLNKKYEKGQFDRYGIFYEDKEAALAWKWLDLNTKPGARIAYTGRNIFYPLFGTNFKNDVFYVSINQKPSMPHYYSDGQYRKEQDYSAWRRNIKNTRINYLFIYLPFEETVFPVEDRWAGGDKGTFNLIFSNSKVRIYSVDSAKF